MRMRSLYFSCILAALTLSASSCKKKDGEEEAAAVDSGAAASAGQSEGKVAHIILDGDLVIVPGMKLRSEQTLKMTAGNFVTASSAGSSQGTMMIIDTEVRDIEFVSLREQLLTLEEKQSNIVMDTGQPQKVEATVKSTLLGQRLSAIQQKDGTWWYGLMAGDADPRQTEELQDMGEAELLAVFTYPEEPVTIGMEWEVGADALPSLLGSSFKPNVARVYFRMNGVKTHEGQRCAELGIRVEAAGEYRIGEDQLPVKMVVDMKGTLLHSLNTFQDLMISLKGVMTLEHSPAGGTSIRSDGNIEFVRVNKIGS